ncbi:hypothetical protein BJ742DRAFT_780791 [Cladochytrium replicatum]|nr:hypothetical protein BJ742DRAFT_780791 [Cladochytrium replicatum]
MSRLFGRWSLAASAVRNSTAVLSCAPKPSPPYLFTPSALCRPLPLTTPPPPRPFHSTPATLSLKVSLSVRQTRKTALRYAAKRARVEARALKRNKLNKDGKPRMPKPKHTSTIPPYIAGTRTSEAQILPFLATPDKPVPDAGEIVQGDWRATWRKYQEKLRGGGREGDVKAWAEEKKAVKKGGGGIRQASVKRVEAAEVDTTGPLTMPILRVPDAKTPKLSEEFEAAVGEIRAVDGLGAVRIGSELFPRPLLASPEKLLEPTAAHEGPYYAHGVRPVEVQLLLEDAPATMRERMSEDASMEEEEKAEMVRRILSIGNASAEARRKFNIARVVETFGRRPFDSGSPEVQAAVFTVRIKAIQDHLETHKKDMSTKRKLEGWIGKRAKILRYLRRMNLGQYVVVCRALGVDPNAIRG